MRKKVIFGTVAALFLGAGILTSVNLTQKPKMSNLTLANIEAMSFDADYDREKTEAGCDGKNDSVCSVTTPDGFTLNGYGNPYYKRIGTGIGVRL